MTIVAWLKAIAGGAVVLACLWLLTVGLYLTM